MMLENLWKHLQKQYWICARLWQGAKRPKLMTAQTNKHQICNGSKEIWAFLGDVFKRFHDKHCMKQTQIWNSNEVQIVPPIHTNIFYIAEIMPKNENRIKYS
jgi:hypothetical protein